SLSVSTVSGASGILSVSESFGSFGRYYKSIFPARDAKSNSIGRPKFSNPKNYSLIPQGGSDRKSRHQEVGEWSLEECRHSIMELAKEMNRVLKISAIPTPVSSEDTCSLEECRGFIMKWAGDLDKLVQTPKQSQSAGQVEQRKWAELRNKEDLPGPEGEELSEGAGQNQGEELSQKKEQRLKDGHDIIMKWARELKTVPENSVSAGEAVEQGLAELVKEWKQGKLSNILPIMEFIMWALIKEKADKGIVTRMWFSRMLKSQNIGAGRCIPDSAMFSPLSFLPILLSSLSLSYTLPLFSTDSSSLLFSLISSPSFSVLLSSLSLSSPASPLPLSLHLSPSLPLLHLSPSLTSPLSSPASPLPLSLHLSPLFPASPLPSLHLSLFPCLSSPLSLFTSLLKMLM
ncbi:hypothetical protein HHUSO_G29946, partial [Huso huso]